jgi:beta-lactam-binding protein with PASTA domain
MIITSTIAVIIVIVIVTAGATIMSMIFSIRKRKNQIVFSKSFKTATEEEMYNKIMSDINQ